MTRTQSNFLMVVGFFLTFGAVGGIENDGPLFEGLVVAAVGLGTLGCGVLGMRVLDSQNV
jgi:hypothetical protein